MTQNEIKSSFCLYKTWNKILDLFIQNDEKIIIIAELAKEDILFSLTDIMTVKAKCNTVISCLLK